MGLYGDLPQAKGSAAQEDNAALTKQNSWTPSSLAPPARKPSVFGAPPAVLRAGRGKPTSATQRQSAVRRESGDHTSTSAPTPTGDVEALCHWQCTSALLARLACICVDLNICRKVLVKIPCMTQVLPRAFFLSTCKMSTTLPGQMTMRKSGEPENAKGLMQRGKQSDKKSCGLKKLHRRSAYTYVTQAMSCLTHSVRASGSSTAASAMQVLCIRAHSNTAMEHTVGICVHLEHSVSGMQHSSCKV